MGDKLYELMREYYNDFLEKKERISKIIVEPSFPIVWFGNTRRYFHSKIKVVTMGLNPSNSEFPDYNPELRFPGARVAYEQGNMGRVCDSLNGYFDRTRAPYWKWFDAYERVLGSMKFGVTYGKCPTAENYAVHIDFFSAIATDPTYGNLKRDEKRLLGNTELFDKLFGYLTDNWDKPVIILFSTSKEEICKHFKLSEKNMFYTASDRGIVRVEAFQVGNKFYIWGKPNIKPFHRVSDEVLEKSMDEICHLIGVIS